MIGCWTKCILTGRLELLQILAMPGQVETSDAQTHLQG